MQEYNRIEDTEYISDAPSQLNKNMESIATDFSGASFPTENLFVGMKCLRTDENAIYRLYENASNQLVWQLEYTIVDGGIKVKEADDLPASKYATQAQAEEGVDNTTVMTPKGVDYRLNKDRQIVTYNSFEELGLNPSTATVLDVAKKLPGTGGELITYINEQSNPSEYPYLYCILKVIKRSNRVFALLSSMSQSNTSKNSSIWYRIGDSSALSDWRLVLDSSKIATQSEAEAGTDNTKVMTPLTAKKCSQKYGLTYKADNPITSPVDDTVANWDELGSGVYWFDKVGCLNTQPNQYGFLVNIVGHGNLFQLWGQQTSGPMYFRNGAIATKVLTDWKKIATNGALSMPSEQFINVSVTASGYKYTAPADGWFSLYAEVTDSSSSAYLMVSTGTGNGVLGDRINIPYNLSYSGFYKQYPMTKGRTYTIQYYNMSINAATFHYAQSEV